MTKITPVPSKAEAINIITNPLPASEFVIEFSSTLSDASGFVVDSFAKADTLPVEVVDSKARVLVVVAASFVLLAAWVLPVVLAAVLEVDGAVDATIWAVVGGSGDGGFTVSFGLSVGTVTAPTGLYEYSAN